MSIWYIHRDISHLSTVHDGILQALNIIDTF
uniref:Uncharacterized protein n=1 Tax=Arundo donax TaxID=35708 RepID=A0A0A8YEQ7_ARUDO